MRKEIEELAKTITPETKIADLVGKVETLDEITFLLQHIKSQPKSEELSDKLKLRALTELKGLPKEDLTIPKIQKTMLIGYPKAAAIRDWLISGNITNDLIVERENAKSKETPSFDDDFVVLEFSKIDCVKDKRTYKVINECKPIILEVAAVKISNCKINGYYHTFVKTDGYDIADIDLKDAYYSLMPEYFIDAPSFKEVVEKLYAFVGNATIAIKSVTYTYDAFFSFKEQAKECGYIFENKVVSLWTIISTAELEEQVRDNEIDFNETNILDKAELLQNCYKKLDEVLERYNVEFYPFTESACERNRNDPLSWAIAYAKVLGAILEEGSIRDIFG